MIKTSETYIKKISLQKVGSKLKNTPNVTALKELETTEDERDVLQPFFLQNIKNKIDLLKFTHHIEVSYNPLYKTAKQFFEKELDFMQLSHNVLNHLYEKSNHPQIKTGELFVVHFEQINFQDIMTEAIGIFKIERKSNFIKFSHEDQGMGIKYIKGVGLQKIDKACMIFNTEKDEGFRLLSADNNNYDAQYWLHSFLDVEEVKNDAYQTRNYVQLLSKFSEEVGIEKDLYTQKEFISQGLKILDENEFVNDKLFEENLLQPFDLNNEDFSRYKKVFEQSHDINLESSFNVSESALKKEKKKIKNEINLDTKIQIKLDLDDIELVSENIERGYDESKRMHYYKVFYNEEN